MQDLTRWYSDQISRIDPSCYEKDIDLAWEGSITLYRWMQKEFDFHWGDEIPEEVTSQDIFECIEEYEI